LNHKYNLVLVPWEFHWQAMSVEPLPTPKIQITKISVGTSTTEAIELMMPHSHIKQQTTMSWLEQSSLQLGQSNSTLTKLYTEKIRKAAWKSAIDIAVNKLVSAKNHLKSSKPKAWFNLYDVTIQSLLANGIQITKATLQTKSQGQSIAK
jgi:hypothetical protein